MNLKVIREIAKLNIATEFDHTLNFGKIQQISVGLNQGSITLMEATLYNKEAWKLQIDTQK
jgi:hypothetical protein